MRGLSLFSGRFACVEDFGLFILLLFLLVIFLVWIFCLLGKFFIIGNFKFNFWGMFVLLRFKFIKMVFFVWFLELICFFFSGWWIFLIIEFGVFIFNRLVRLFDWFFEYLIFERYIILIFWDVVGILLFIWLYLS